jgi:hypothetical protein
MTTHQTGGSTGYRGYDYQIVVTVWLALKLMLEKRLCAAIEVEPASDEDVEAKLDVPADAAAAQLGLAMDPIELDVQVKSRDSGQWTESGFRDVLNGPPVAKSKVGATKRPKTTQQPGRDRPLARLRGEPKRRFLMVTDAQLHPDLREFSVSEIGSESAARALPLSAQSADAGSLARRIGIFAQQTKEFLQLQIRDLLSRHGHIQPATLDECLRDLQDAVRDRLLRQAEAKWSADELHTLLRKHGGLPPPPPEIVPPANMEEIRACLERGAVLLTGPPGSGKTFVAEHLVHEHRTAEPPFQIVTSADGIEHIRHCLREPGRHLFVFSDPWGHYRLEPDADFWRSELPKLFDEAAPEKTFLVTSRSGVKAQAFGSAAPAAFVASEIAITPADYPVEARKRILHLHMRGAAAWQRDLALREENRIIRELDVPFSLQQFARALRRESDESGVDVEELIRRSNLEVISRTCADEVKALGSENVAAGIALWSLFMTQELVSEARVNSLRQQLEEGGYRSSIDPLKLLRWLNHAGRLLQVGDDFSLHPTVMKGLELLIDDEPALAQLVLGAQIQTLSRSEDRDKFETLAKYIVSRSLLIPAPARTVLNDHLRAQMLTLDGAAWQQAFRATAKFSTATDAVSLIVRKLRPIERQGMRGFEHWQPPLLDAKEVSAITASGEARQVAAKFIRQFLANDPMLHCEAEDLVGFFSQFGWDLSDEFFAVVKDALEEGRSISMDLFVEAALRTDHPRFDEIIGAGLDALDGFNTWFTGYQEEIRQAEQCETDAAHASHVDEEPSERHWPIETALKTAVRSRRAREGYAWLLDHPRRSDLLWSWAASVTENVSEAELADIRRVCEPGDQRPFWKAVENAGRSALANEVGSGLKVAREAHLGACLETLAKLLSADEWQTFLKKRGASLSTERKLVLVATNFHADTTGEHARVLRVALFDPDQLRAIDLCLGVDEDPQPAGQSSETISQTTRDFLRQIAQHGPERLAVTALHVLGAPPDLASEQLPRFLSSPLMQTRLNALVLIARATLTGQWRGAVVNALRDEDYRCRRMAMRMLAADATSEEKELILARQDDASAPVRLTCAELIGEHGWPEGEPVLIKLLNDTRDASEGGWTRFSMPNHHVARAAASAIGRFKSLSANAVGDIIHFIDTYRPDGERHARQDISVPYHLLIALAAQPEIGVMGLFLRRLKDKWFVEGTEQSGYPLRFAAAWGAVVQISERRDLREGIDPGVFVDGATHTDDRLAGPCLMVLGMFGNSAYREIITVSASGEFTPERALIIATTLPAEADSARAVIEKALAPDSPQRRFFEWAERNASASREVGERYLSENGDVAAWLNEIQSNEGIFPELRFALAQRFDAPLGHKLESDGLSARHLPKAIPILTMRSMFGGE